MTLREDQHELISPQQAAKIFGVTDRTVLRYIERGDLPAVRLPGGRLYRIKRSDVESLLSAGAQS